MEVVVFNVLVGVLVLIIQCVLNFVHSFCADDHTFIELKVEEDIIQ